MSINQILRYYNTKRCTDVLYATADDGFTSCIEQGHQ